VVSDANVGAGVRRIEAVTGFGALELTRRLSSTLQRAADTLKAPVGELAARVEKTLEHLRELQREIESLKRQLMTGGGGAAEVTTLAGGNHLVVARAPWATRRGCASWPTTCGTSTRPRWWWSARRPPEGKALLVVAVSKEAHRNFHAGKIVGQLAAVVGGRGGGRPDMAGAGGPDAAKLDEALRQVSPSSRRSPSILRDAAEPGLIRWPRRRKGRVEGFA
jgi:alanyl-tRNA synthetase